MEHILPASKYGPFAKAFTGPAHPVVEPLADAVAEVHGLKESHYPRLLVCRHWGFHNVSPLAFAAKTVLKGTIVAQAAFLGPAGEESPSIPELWSLALLPKRLESYMPQSLRGTQARKDLDAELEAYVGAAAKAYEVRMARGKASAPHFPQEGKYRGPFEEYTNAVMLRALARTSLYTGLEAYHAGFGVPACRTCAEVYVFSDSVRMASGLGLNSDGAFLRLFDTATWKAENKARGRFLDAGHYGEARILKPDGKCVRAADVGLRVADALSAART